MVARLAVRVAIPNSLAVNYQSSFMRWIRMLAYPGARVEDVVAVGGLP